ncbi:MAG: penicillin-binding protein [Rikenellaceae bacterium]|nr:penicillin-binding protein [Rikenellaceae bacterium]
MSKPANNKTTTPKRKPTKRWTKKRLIKWIWGLVYIPIGMVCLVVALTALGVFGKLPTFEELENPKSALATEIYSEDGKLLGSFFIENRSNVSYDELSPSLVAALVATEDSRYYSHSGIDFRALARVVVKTLAGGNASQGGGSTITQQLAKNLFPRGINSAETSIGRKIKLVFSKFKEWIVAVKLEHNYTKEEIVAMYFNTMNYGSNAVGIKSAAQTFFGKHPSELSIQESAVLVGVLNATTRYSPVRNYDNSLKRRNLVLGRMNKQGFISDHMYDSISALPIELNYRPISQNEGLAPYFRSMIRQVMNAPEPKRKNYWNEYDYNYELERWNSNPIYGWCHKNTKPDGSKYNLDVDGLKIYTTVNSTMQAYAEEALTSELRKTQVTMDAQVRATRTLFANTTPEQREKIINNAMRTSDRWREMRNSGFSKEEITASFSVPCKMRIFTYKGICDTVMTPRDSILHHKQIMRGSFVAIDPHTGHVKAYIGGPNFRYFKYDMAKQSKRQPGSTIKPFIYTFAIDHLGFTPCTMVPNLPVTIETYTGEPWTPKEAGKVEYTGELKPLKWGLANSRNNYSAWIMKQAKQPEAVADFIHNMGVHSFIDPVYALCLGSSEVSLFEMTSAFATFANHGVNIDPIFVTRIEDRQGNMLASFVPTSNDAISEETANIMLGMLQNVVNAGTAGRLRWMYGFKGEIAGKTGTSQENRDAWFIGITPKLVAGVWVGAEDQSVRLDRNGEGSARALPIFGEFMKRVYATPRLGVYESDSFGIPYNLLYSNCEEELQQAQPTTSIEEDDEFFD